jgi:hypothetical protein
MNEEIINKEEIQEQLKNIREYFNEWYEEGYITDEFFEYHNRVEKLLEMLGFEPEEL